VREILTVSEVATWLKVHPSSIYRLIKRRDIPCFRVGSDWRFVARDLELWLEQITVMGRPAPSLSVGRTRGANQS
jgi:excisionase family DNA binding protein